MGMSISSLSTIEVIVPIQAITTAGPLNPSTDQVQFAFKSRGSPPVLADWVTGAWAGAVNGWYWAQCLVGPASGASGTILSIGSYVIWTKVQDNPEIPVFEAGSLTITP